MVRRGRSGRGSTSSGAPSRNRPRVYADRVCLPADYAGCPSNRVCLSPSSVTYPIPFSSRYMYVSIL
ncbi:hypothetical protein Taro_007878 [Colocasia esculenta]|uniref:Uncharacterized protein n=1 Tax=Colocasia esculenta TaxID=4460 RepID=A0A843TZI2_COLES|nr:hypothetical protein [Colocasia esculenta]